MNEEHVKFVEARDAQFYGQEILTIDAPKEWLDIHNIGRFRKPNAWHRFWAWFLLGWKWDENLWRK